MTPVQLKRALRMYDAYKCLTREYRELAEELGIQVTDLNQRCYEHRQRSPRKKRGEM